MPSFPSGVPTVMVPFQFLRHNQLFQRRRVIASGGLLHAGNGFLRHSRQLIAKFGDTVYIEILAKQEINKIVLRQPVGRSCLHWRLPERRCVQFGIVGQKQPVQQIAKVRWLLPGLDLAQTALDHVQPFRQ